jgi:hypothetical protein
MDRIIMLQSHSAHVNSHLFHKEDIVYASEYENGQA